MKLIKNDLYLLLIDEETKINLIDLVYDWFNNQIRKYEDIGTGRKIIAHYPLTKDAQELDLPLLPNPFEKKCTEQIVAEFCRNSENVNYNNIKDKVHLTFLQEDMILLYNQAQSNKQFSLEDIKKAMEYGMYKMKYHTIEAQEEFIQSLSTQRAPKEFIPEYNLMNEGYDKPEDYPYQECKVLKTTTNSSGKIELVGIYKY